MSYDDTNTGVLFKAKQQPTDRHPGYNGKIDIEGKVYWLAAWVNKSKAGEKYFSIKAKPKDEDQAPAVDYKADEDLDDGLDDEIPF